MAKKSNTHREKYGFSIWEWKHPKGVKQGNWSLLSNQSACGCVCVCPPAPKKEPDVGKLKLVVSKKDKKKK